MESFRDNHGNRKKKVQSVQLEKSDLDFILKTQKGISSEPNNKFKTFNFFSPLKNLYKHSSTEEIASIPTNNANNNPNKRSKLNKERENLCRQFWSFPMTNQFPRELFQFVVDLCQLSHEIFAFSSGPDQGILVAEPYLPDYDSPHFQSYKARKQTLSHKATGISISLYNRNFQTNARVGDPIADTFIVSARANNAILVIADGVNWGEAPRLAARCAVLAAFQSLEQQLFSLASINSTSFTQRSFTEIFAMLHTSFKAAQNCIIRSRTTGFTTLCATLVLPLSRGPGIPEQPACNISSNNNNNDDDDNANNPEPPAEQLFGVFTLNLGDSLCFVLSQAYGIRELTVGSHKLDQVRNLRDSGGALGRVVNGIEPEWNNLTRSFCVCTSGDIVFLTTDGVSDNFDPVVCKMAHPMGVGPQIDYIDNEETKAPNNKRCNPVGPTSLIIPSGYLYTSSWLVRKPPHITDDISQKQQPVSFDNNNNQHHNPNQKYSQNVDVSCHGNNSGTAKNSQKHNKNHSNTSTADDSTATSIVLQNGGAVTEESAKMLNFTGKMELSAVERHQYALKEMERQWHEQELMLNGTSHGGSVGHSLSALGLCTLLTDHTRSVTRGKRELLENYSRELADDKTQRVLEREKDRTRRKASLTGTGLMEQLQDSCVSAVESVTSSKMREVTATTDNDTGRIENGDRSGGSGSDQHHFRSQSRQRNRRRDQTEIVTQKDLEEARKLTQKVRKINRSFLLQERLKFSAGKLDHATCVAYEVGLNITC